MRRLPLLLLFLVPGCSSEVDRRSVGGDVDLVSWSSPCGHCGSNDRTLVSQSGETLVDHAWDFSVSPDHKWLISLTGIDAAASTYRLTAVDLDRARVTARQDFEKKGLREDTGPTFTTLWWPNGPKAVCLVQKAARASPQQIVQDSSLHYGDFSVVPSKLRTVFHEPGKTPHLTAQSWSSDGMSIAFFLPTSESSSPWKLMHLKLSDPAALREVLRTPDDVERLVIEWKRGEPALRK